MEVLTIPIKSANDRRNYRYIKLPNGLRALLIADSEPLIDGATGDEIERKSCDSGHISENEALDSGKESGDDEESTDNEDDDDDGSQDSGDESSDIDEATTSSKEKMAAAALCVDSGSFSDPDNLPGMAHFLEHMLFMGSEKYPDENEFDSFIQKHGGNDNAFTDCERTIYHFEVTTKHFKGALDRFAQFFINPLMKKDSTDRELEAIESEFSLRMPSDSVRCEQLLGSLAKANSPASKFMWGNIKSLKTIPEEKGIDIYTRLREFYMRQYSSHYMTLVVLSRENLDTLQEWVVEIFSSVPNNELSPTCFEGFEKPFDTPQFKKLYKVCPVKQIHRLQINWSLPSLVRHYKVKPLGYLGWLVGHEGKGSLLNYLKKKVWATNLWAGNDESNWDHNCLTSVFSIVIDLTESGMDDVQQVLLSVFQYISLLRQKGPQESIYQEIRMLDENAFRWADERGAQDYVETLCQNMQIYEAEDIIRGDQLLMQYDGNLISQCTESLDPDSCNIMILSNRFKKDDPCDKTEAWMQTLYSQEDIPLPWKDSWKNPPPNVELYLPPENPFIATDFDIKMTPEQYNTEFPVKLFEDSRSRLWYKKDNKFCVPKAYIYVQLISPLCKCSLQNDALLDLFIDNLHHNLSSEAYNAKMATLHYDIYREDGSLVVRVYGFNHKLPVLLDTILDHLSNFIIDSDFFESLKTQLLRLYFNNFIKPGKLCNELRLSLLEEIYWTSLEKHALMAKITQEQLLNFVRQFMDTLYVETMVLGNFSPEEALNIDERIKSKLNYTPLPPDAFPKLQVIEFPQNEKILRVLSFNTEDRNSCVTNYYQLGPGTIYTSSLNSLLLNMMEEPCFDQLRTREQLGYCVNCNFCSTFGILGFKVTVRSSGDKYCCSYLNERIENFLKDFMAHLTQIPEEEFNSHVTSLIKTNNRAMLNMKEEANRNWYEVVGTTYIFDRHKRENKCLEKLTLEEFKQWAVKIVSDLMESGPKLSVQVVGPGTVSLEECNVESFVDGQNIDRNENDLEKKTASETTVFSLQTQLPKNNPQDASFIRDISTFKEDLSLFPPWKIIS